MHEDDIADFLRSLMGRLFCHACLAKMLDLSYEHLRTLTKRLRVVRGFRIDARQCSNCEQPRVVFGFSALRDR